MPQKPETKFQLKVEKELKKLHDTWYFKAQLVARRGIPDYIICCAGTFVAWELKTEDGRLSALQSYNLDLIDSAGGIARVVTPSTLKENLEELHGRINQSKHTKTS